MILWRRLRSMLFRQSFLPEYQHGYRHHETALQFDYTLFDTSPWSMPRGHLCRRRPCLDINKLELVAYICRPFNIFSMRITENLQENFPFISVITHVSQEYVGIIINQDAAITSLYDYASIKTEPEKAKFLELGEAWWWESNRQIPINIFLSREIFEFRYAIKNFSTKDVRLVLGPCTSLNDIITKRIKRKSITLVRKAT